MTPISASSVSPSFTPSPPLKKEVRFSDTVDIFLFSTQSPKRVRFSNTVDVFLSSTQTPPNGAKTLLIKPLNGLLDSSILKKRDIELEKLIDSTARAAFSNMIVVDRQGNFETFSSEKHSFAILFSNFKAVLYILLSIGDSYKKNKTCCNRLFDPTAPYNSHEYSMFIGCVEKFSIELLRKIS